MCHWPRGLGCAPIVAARGLCRWLLEPEVRRVGFGLVWNCVGCFVRLNAASGLGYLVGTRRHPCLGGFQTMESFKVQSLALMAQVIIEI
ncbi:hypothetical protein V8C40DRAFT_244048 [Trichoderma camerunense]